MDNGFYYEMALPEGAAVQSSDWAPLENIVSKIVKEKQPFQRLVSIRLKSKGDADPILGNDQGRSAEDVFL